MTVGPRGYFEEIDKLEIEGKLQGRKASRVTQTVLIQPPPTPLEDTSLGYIGRIVAFCRAEGIDLRIFLTPAHVHQAEIAAAADEESWIEGAKRDLVHLLAEDAARHPGESPIPLWDFSGYSTVTTEPLPAPGSRNEMRYYWDSSHFKEIIGDYVLDRLFGISNPHRRVPHDFGVRLTADNIEFVLARDRAAQQLYRSTYPEDIRKIRALVAEELGPS